MTGADHEYSSRVLELFRALPTAGDLEAGEGTVIAGEAIALDRGAWVRFEARAGAGRIVDMAFRAFGCPHTLAAAALASLSLRGHSLAEATVIDAAWLARELEAPPEKMGRLLVVEDALRALIQGSPRVQ
jgi:NifU-like protein involved in Fe-S cluster formation